MQISTPGRLTRSGLIQILFLVRSRRQLIAQMQYNHLFRWFVWLGTNNMVWIATVFSRNRDHLLTTDTSSKFLNAVL